MSTRAQGRDAGARGESGEHGTDRRAIVCHGAGSSAAAARLLVPPDSLGAQEVAYPEDRTGDVEEVMRVLDAWDRGLDEGTERVVAGISLGAHAAARWAARRPRGRGERLTLVLALPAWTGPPGPAADATRASARQVRQLGIAGVLDSLAASDQGERAPILDLLALAWSSYDEDELARALERAAVGWGPTAADLRSLACPASVATWEADPFHPRDVGRAWAQALPRGREAPIPWTALAERLGTLGTLAAGAAGLP